MYKNICKKQILWGSMICLVSSSAFSSSLRELSDAEMAVVEGQSLLSLSYLSPTDSANYEGANNIGFYRLGMDATIDINANIKKLQLGCGGINGAGACDIDIDNLSLSGNSSTRDGRVSSSAQLINPFIEIAVKNPDTASTREITGVRLSAEKAIGLLTAGTSNGTTPNGINTISGFMRVQSDSSGYIYGKAKTAAAYLDAAQNIITGQVQVTGLGGLATLSIETTGGGLSIPAMQNIPFIRSGKVINQNRLSSLPLTANLNVPPIKTDYRGVYPANGTVIYNNPVESPIDWSFNVPQEVNTTGGALNAIITDCNGLGCLAAAGVGISPGKTLQNIFLKGNITDIMAIANINQSLGYIHNLPINSPFYLSLQNQNLRWPGTYSGPNPENPAQTVADIAQRGWWLSLADPIDLGSVDPTQDIDISPLFPQIASQVSDQIDPRRGAPGAQYISIGFGSVVNAISGTGDVNVSTSQNISLSNPLLLNLSNLQLNGQSFAPNCWGTLTFC